MADIKEYLQGLKGRTYKKAAETSENDSKSKKPSIFSILSNNGYTFSGNYRSY